MAKHSPLARFLLLLIMVVMTLALVTAAGAQVRLTHGTTHAHHRRATRHHGRHHERHRRGAHPAKHRKAKRTGKEDTGAIQAPSSAGTTASSVAGTSASGAGNPSPGARFYVYPNDSAVREENALVASGDSSEAAQIEKIASQPEGIWLASDGSAAIVPGIMSAAASSGTVPVFVVYDIPGRDCGGYSSGGASGAGDYESFINSVVAGLGQGKAVVVVEPDALTNLAEPAPCGTMGSDGSLIGYAVQQLDTDVNADVYVDAGNPGWKPAAAEASELQQVLGSTRAGFAVNVSNFATTAADVAYGTAISQATGGRHFVIDTSRNGGSVASGEWCNPAGAGIGVDPTTDTGNPLVDAFLWIKDVGESDGTCNGGPPAGQFWPSYAFSLVANG